MPIKPENRARYPNDWPEIRNRILERAQWRCQWPGCGVRHHAVGHWKQHHAGAWQFVPLAGNMHCDDAGWGHDLNTGTRLTWGAARDFVRANKSAEPGLLVIVLTIAHLDHQPENCADYNLRAWCQRHHLAYDREHHQANAYRTRKDRACTADIFEAAP